MVPTLRFLLFFLPAVPAVALGGLDTPLGLAGLAWGLLVVGALVADNRLSLRLCRPEVRRRAPRRLSLGAANPVEVRVDNASRWTLRLQVKDDAPPEFALEPATVEALVPAHDQLAVSYNAIPPRRGQYRFGDLHVRGLSFLGLSLWQRRVAAGAAVEVYPNLRSVARFELLLRAKRIEEAGFRRARVRGAGTEFESLREYVRDDDYRRVDWKATARRGKPFTRQYEEDRSRTVMLLIDAGRMMTAEVEGLSKLDHAINAALLLAHVALRHDDAVGLIVFADTVRAVVPPRKGHAHLQLLLQTLYDVQPVAAEPDYRAAMGHLHDRARKRSLAVLFTDLIDEEASRRLLAHVAAAYPRHLPLLVTLQDPDVLQASRRDPTTLDALYERAVAASILADRDRALARLRSHGAVALDSPAGEVSVALVNRYLELKERLRV
jgi:uncharacterized protein (DUF58 family)